jgi:hypothetical protein
MRIILSEQQILMLESNGESWGCNLFPENTEQKDWCKCTMGRIKAKYTLIQSEINKIADFLKSQTDLSNTIKFYKEDDPFFSDNLNNLNELANLLSSCGKTNKTINEFKKDVAKKFLFVNKEEDKFTYSLLNRLNTNYSALAYILTDFRNRKDFKNSSFDDIFNSYFGTPKDSMSESYFFNLIVNYLSSKESLAHEKSKEIVDNILKTIKGTDDIGKKTEMEAYKYLVKKFGENNVKDFSGDYSWVDFLGVDMLVNGREGWVPVQIKTNSNECKSNTRFCRNVCIGKKNNSEWDIKEYK